jgi:hypothetical protein
MFGRLFAFLTPVIFSTRTPAMPQAADVVSVLPFLSLARELAALLIPMQPNPRFRDDLERSLTSAARQQNAYRMFAGYDGVPIIRVEQQGTDRRWVIGAATAAAVGSAVSIAGIVAYVLRHRSERVA